MVVGLTIEATTGVTALILPDDMVKNHDNAIIQDLYEYSHYDEMSKGQIVLYTLLTGLNAYGEYKSVTSKPTYEGDYIDFSDPEVRKRISNNGVKDSDFVNGGNDTEVYYRTMNQSDYDYLRMTGELPSTGETFISPTEAFSSNYNGVTVRFEVDKGTTNSLLEIGVGNNTSQSIRDYGVLPQVKSGWNVNNAFFKGEGLQTNIGLGKGKALEIFNSNIVNFSVVGGD